MMMTSILVYVTRMRVGHVRNLARGQFSRCGDRARPQSSLRSSGQEKRGILCFIMPRISLQFCYLCHERCIFSHCGRMGPGQMWVAIYSPAAYVSSQAKPLKSIY